MILLYYITLYFFSSILTYLCIVVLEFNIPTRFDVLDTIQDIKENDIRHIIGDWRNQDSLITIIYLDNIKIVINDLLLYLTFYNNKINGYCDSYINFFVSQSVFHPFHFNMKVLLSACAKNIYNYLEYPNPKKDILV